MGTRKTGGKHVSAAPVSFEKSSHPSRDTQRSSWGRCNHTATSHSLSFSDLRRGTSASPLPSRTSRRRSQALKGHARGTRGRHMEGMSLAALGQAQSGDVPSGQARHAHIRASLIGGRGRPWVPTPRRLSVWPWAPCPGRRRPRSQHRRRFRRLIWQPVGSGPENRLHDICLRLRERTREPQRGTDPRTVNWGWLRAPSRGPRLGADPRTACMTSVCD